MMLKSLTKNDLVKIYIIKPLLRLIYAVRSLFGISERTVVFANDRTDTVSSNFEQMHRAFSDRGEFNFVYLIHDSRNMSSKDKIKLMIKDVLVLAQAHYVFVEDYYFPLCCIKKCSGTRVCQLWHACGAFKKWGYSVLDSSAGTTPELAKRLPLHTNYDLAVTSSSSIIPNYAEAYNMADRISDIQPLGVPRTDVFFDSQYLADCREKFGREVDGSGKKVILYAPTYRGTVNEPSAEFMLPVERLYERFHSDYTLVVKLHPFMSDCVNIDGKLSEFCKVLPSTYDVNELLPVTDVLITDYSSLIFEYSLFSKPMVFFAYDKSKYDDFKGFYYDYETFVPGAIVTDPEKLADAVDAAGDFDLSLLQQFKEKFMGACDGGSADRVAESMLKL